MTKTKDVAAISSPKSPMTQQMSDYERTRANNIQRNNARLRSLGLISVEEEEESNAIAWNQTTTTTKASHTIKTSENQSLKRKRGVPSTKSPSLVKRKSLRLQGKQPDGKVLTAIENEDQDIIRERRQERVKECRMVRLRLANLLASQSDAQKKAAKENPTASYEHCLMRIRTMTDKALQNRIKGMYFVFFFMFVLL